MLFVFCVFEYSEYVYNRSDVVWERVWDVTLVVAALVVGVVGSTPTTIPPTTRVTSHTCSRASPRQNGNYVGTIINIFRVQQNEVGGGSGAGNGGW